jgi:hypothetical protein
MLGEEVMVSTNKAKNVNEVWATTVKGTLDLQSIMVAFKRKGKGKVKYSHRQHTTTESRVEIIQWVAESQRPFEIVEDQGFQSLMKTGWPDYYIPSGRTVSWDVKKVLMNVHKHPPLYFTLYFLIAVTSCKPTGYLPQVWVYPRADPRANPYLPCRYR